jgi:predicted DNA-binding protein
MKYEPLLQKQIKIIKRLCKIQIKSIKAKQQRQDLLGKPNFRFSCHTLYICNTMYCKNLSNVIQCNTRSDMMSISIRLSEKESELIRKYAELNGTTVSEVMRQAILSKIEDEFDIFLYEEAYKEYETNPKTYTLEEAKKILDF